MTIASPIEQPAATTPPDRFASRRFTLYNVPWQAYEAILDALGENRVYLTYNRGRAGIHVTFTDPRKIRALLARLIQMYSHVKRIPLFSLAQTTWRRREAECGLEADQCFYFQHEAQMRHKREIDLAVDPPPDLAIEVDLSSSSVDKEDVYAGLGVPELWRYEDGRVVITTLHKGQYHTATRSLALPDLPISDVNRFLDMRASMGEMELLHAFSDWIEQART